MFGGCPRVRRAFPNKLQRTEGLGKATVSGQQCGTSTAVTATATGGAACWRGSIVILQLIMHVVSTFEAQLPTQQSFTAPESHTPALGLPSLPAPVRWNPLRMRSQECANSVPDSASHPCLSAEMLRDKQPCSESRPITNSLKVHCCPLLKKTPISFLKTWKREILDCVFRAAVKKKFNKLASK